MAVNSAAALIRHQNQRKTKTKPGPVPIAITKRKTVRISLAEKAASAPKTVTIIEATLPTLTNSLCVALGLIKRK